MRYDGYNYISSVDEWKENSRCKLEECKNRTHMACSKCFKLVPSVPSFSFFFISINISIRNVHWYFFTTSRHNISPKGNIKILCHFNKNTIFTNFILYSMTNNVIKLNKTFFFLEKMADVYFRGSSRSIPLEAQIH